jgi:hypothetical protein
MYRLLLLISLWCCSIITSVGQNISVISIVEPASSRYLCPNKNLVVAYLTSGAFNADNKFSIQLEYDSYLNSTKEVLTLETKDSLGFLVGKIPASITKYIRRIRFHITISMWYLALLWFQPHWEEVKGLCL